MKLCERAQVAEQKEVNVSATAGNMQKKERSQQKESGKNPSELGRHWVGWQSEKDHLGLGSGNN